MKCTWPSMNPGSTVPPCASMTLVAAPARRFMSRFEPTRRISLPRTASASAGSWPGSGEHAAVEHDEIDRP